MVNYLRFKQLLVIAALLLASIFSFAYDFEVDGIYYNKLSENTVEVTCHPQDYDGEIEIPSTISYDGNLFNVIAIASGAFSNDKEVTKIHLPETISSIGSNAFSNCRSLTEINIPKNIVEIEPYTFDWCESLESIIIPDNVTDIGKGAFECCFKLGNVILPNGLKSIGESAFIYCSNMTSVIIPSLITCIESDAFQSSGLEEIELPESMTKIKSQAFGYCGKIKKISCKSQTPPTCGKDAFNYASRNTCIIYIPEGCLEAYKNSSPWNEFENIKCNSGETPATCEAPTIAFDNDAKKLVFNSATEGATYHCTITSDDMMSDKAIDSEATMTGIYNITVYASAEGMYNSEKTTAKLCWVSAAIESDGILTAKADRGVIVSSNANQINISGTVNGETIEVYNVGGSKLKAIKANSGNTTINGLQSGNMYIIKIGGNKVKVVL